MHGHARAAALATAGTQRQSLLLPRRPLGLICRAAGLGQQWRRRPSFPLPTPPTTPLLPTARLLLPRSRATPTDQDQTSSIKKKQGWRLLDGQAYLERWDVPWSGGAAAGWMLSWFATFALSAFVLSPALYFALFPPPKTDPAKPSVVRLSNLPPSEQAQFALASEAVEASVTAALLGVVAARHGGSSSQPNGLSSRGLLQLFGPPEEEEEDGKNDDRPRRRRLRPPPALKAPRGWLGWGLIGALAAPVVVGSTAALLSFLHYDEYFAAGKGTADAVAGMVETGGGGSGDAATTTTQNALALVTYIRLFAVTAVLAPLLEESVFRGFLLPSLTKYLPVPLAIVLSSAAFAAAHLSVRDAPVLFALGCLLGCVYVRSRALASPMLVHGLWNGTVLTVLFALSAAGVDLDAMLHPAAGAGAAGAAGAGAAGASGASADVALQWMRAMMVV
jgi:membrane protease YdiL (CAAX protease family)